MSTGAGSRLERRVIEAAEAALAQRSFVTAIDVLIGLGWLAPETVDRWQQGRFEYLDGAMQASPEKL